ncbi:MAG: TIGR02221 family CRISPR-associated protein [Cyanobacteria bacterium J007]|jgi:CRISPR-associated Csx2 family protein|nr:MAG: TIGR02221 family CRISPR-associated protein [Cyanobacteria bacterium J007]
MAKILISSIGTGSLDRNATERKYRTAQYKIDEKLYESSFIASVLDRHLDVDRIVLIGTVKSMWEGVYEQFCDRRQIEKDFNYYTQLIEVIENANHLSQLDSIDLSPIEKLLGNHSRCITIHYGLNETELNTNFNRIFELIDLVEKGDEIYIDITHSFRSLSLFLFLVLTFLNDIASDRAIEIKGVYYGMFEAIQELGHAPIVNLQSLFNITRWIKGGYSFQSFGNGYLIASLLEENGETSLAQSISQLSNTINLNYIPKLRQHATDLKRELSNTSTTSPLQYLQPELKRFADRFSRHGIPDSELQLDLAQWYFQNKRYATGYIALVEAIITYACEFQHVEDLTNYAERKKAKDFLKDRCDTALSKLFFEKANPIRKAIAHAALDEQRTDPNTAINNAIAYCNEARRIFRSKGLG